MTKEEVAVLTGRKRLADQARWLTEHGYKFEINAAGLPIVLRLSVETRLGTHRKPSNRPTPRFENLPNG